MKRKIFWQVCLILLISVTLVFSVGLWAVYENSRYIVYERLVAEAELLSHLITTEEDIAQLEAYENRDDFRITVIGEDGEVLYESSMSGVPENHADREEVKGALTGTPHTVERYSETFGCKMTYYAVGLTFSDGETVVLRLAVRSAEITAYFLLALPIFILVVLVSLTVSAVLASRLSRNVSDKVRGVATSLKSLSDGEYVPIETDTREPEFYEVFRAINELNEQTHRHIRTADEEREKLNTVLDNVAQGIIALDPFDNMAFANNSALEMFGGSREDIGKHMIYLIEDSMLYQKVTAHTDCEGTFEHAYGDRELAVTIRRISDETLAGTVSSIIIITDITKEKSIIREKSDFFANASHELKTPITVMQGLTELMLSKGGLDDASHKQIERIHKEALRMAGLIADMLKLSSLEQHAEELQMVPLDLRTIADEAVAELATSCRERSITIMISGNGKICADPKKIYELIGNLCANAVHYNKENGSVFVKISQDIGHTVLTVSDTGIGIAKEHLPRLCERFYRVDKSRSKKTGGTGLGLAIVKHICALYGAELKIESKLGVGTRVTVVFNA